MLTFTDSFGRRFCHVHEPFSSFFYILFSLLFNDILYLVVKMTQYFVPMNIARVSFGSYRLACECVCVWTTTLKKKYFLLLLPFKTELLDFVLIENCHLHPMYPQCTARSSPHLSIFFPKRNPSICLMYHCHDCHLFHSRLCLPFPLNTLLREKNVGIYKPEKEKRKKNFQSLHCYADFFFKN